MKISRMTSHAQRGMALLISLVFLLLLTLIGISSMQNATLQEKMAGSVTLRNQSFQLAEATLRMGESAVQLANYTLAACGTGVPCAPPAEALTLTGAGVDARSGSGVNWIAAGGGFYGVQNLGATMGAVNVPSNTSATLYRITAVGIVGNNIRSVVESIYAKY
ncbi:PilX N-terminal domain-containing pilus assembly protein [Pseudomonas sp. dw_612]|uniref:pilus assembly PilX family protein n=1 Tax=Pseudomonas sp. dw_612 TaxID=2720080 RepID=UPI001BD2EF42|nr:PilX N-terminal domain-containing pilus assembly protein [Pseudomonas sp. dw_612]